MIALLICLIYHAGFMTLGFLNLLSMLDATYILSMLNAKFIDVGYINPATYLVTPFLLYIGIFQKKKNRRLARKVIRSSVKGSIKRVPFDEWESEEFSFFKFTLWCCFWIYLMQDPGVYVLATSFALLILFTVRYRANELIGLPEICFREEECALALVYSVNTTITHMVLNVTRKYNSSISWDIFNAYPKIETIT